MLRYDYTIIGGLCKSPLKSIWRCISAAAVVDDTLDYETYYDSVKMIPTTGYFYVQEFSLHSCGIVNEVKCFCGL